MADAPYPELKKTHSMARKGRPWRDYKPPPSGPVWAVIQASNTYWMLVAALDLGVFDAFSAGERKTCDQLATKIGASSVHLRHLLDAMTTFGFLDQTDNLYELTETAERYLCSDGAASMAALVRVSNGPLENWTHLAETIRTGKPHKPIEDDLAGFYAPLVEATFATQFRAAGRLGLQLGWARTPGLNVLDLGAGRAPWAAAVLDQSPNSRATVNDVPGVLNLAQETLAQHGFAERATYLEGDFHTVDLPADTFDLVILGHVCRTEGPEWAPRLIARAAEALKPGGRLLVADYFADNDRKLNPFGVQMGLTMLANTERGEMLTNAQMQGWLSEAGLERIRLLEPIGFNFVYVATKPT